MNKRGVMVVIGTPREELLESGAIVYFVASLEEIGRDTLADIITRLRTGKRTRHAMRDEDDHLRGSDVHRLSRTNEQIVCREHPRAEWHCMKTRLPLHVFVATVDGVPVAVAAPVSAVPSQDEARIARWENAGEVGT